METVIRILVVLISVLLGALFRMVLVRITNKNSKVLGAIVLVIGWIVCIIAYWNEWISQVAFWIFLSFLLGLQIFVGEKQK